MSGESQVLEVTAGSASGKQRTGIVHLVDSSGNAVFDSDSLKIVGSVRDYAGDGAPAASARATLARNPAGDDNALAFTAVKYGVYGNGITIAYVNGGASQSLSVSVVDKAITVNLATNGSSVITSTAAQVKAAIEASAAAAALVTCTINTGDTGSADDGSGVVTALAAANMTGGAGIGYNSAGVGQAGVGSRYTDYTNANLYINAGTAAVPVWKLFTRAA